MWEWYWRDIRVTTDARSIILSKIIIGNNKIRIKSISLTVTYFDYFKRMSCFSNFTYLYEYIKVKHGFKPVVMC